MLSRRAILATLAATPLLHSTSRAQQAAPKRIAIASATIATEAMIEGAAGDPGWVAFFNEMKAQGFTAGTNVTYERYSGAQFNQVRRLQGTRWNGVGTNIAGTKPDVLFATSSYIARGAATAADTLPVVFLVGDPVASGLVESLAQPGGNLTGVASAAGDTREAMRLQLLKEAVPAAARAAYLLKSQENSPTPWGVGLVKAAQAAGAALAMTVTPAYFDDVRDDVGLDATAHLRAVLEAQRGGAQALAIGEALDITEYAGPLGGMALALKLPAIAPWREFVLGGGLMSYGPNQAGMFTTAAQQVARILKGEKAGTIPIAQPAPELVISQRNARHIGVTLPQALVAKAKEVLA
jgi:putative tryptophan/tyrosine transport system substrate-binding protein